MWSEFFEQLSGWYELDTWIVITAALTAMACALPGNFVYLRRQSMMGDALSHTALLGIVVAFMIVHGMQTAGWFGAGKLGYQALLHAAMFGGAVVVGVIAAWLTELVQKLGRVEASAALGVVFTTLFALGLLMIRIFADSVHIDPGCVFYGNIESATAGETGIPAAAKVCGTFLLINGLLCTLFYKELRISAFDPALATALGINAQFMHYAVMGVTAATLVAAFESVGSILVIAMLIAPPATAHLLTDRLSRMIWLSLVIAAASAVLGHVAAITLPHIIFSRLGYPMVEDASTAGMMAVASGVLFALAWLFGPRHGILSQIAQRTWLGLKIAGEDLLGLLYRLEERHYAGDTRQAPEIIERVRGLGPLTRRLAVLRLVHAGQVVRDAHGFRLTDRGRAAARDLVRSHRLWESYLARHFVLPADHLHDSAERMEHFISGAMRDELVQELQQPQFDPHGKAIPGDDAAVKPAE
jgi:manganese/zinc/iron transport system permease protein